VQSIVVAPGSMGAGRVGVEGVIEVILPLVMRTVWDFLVVPVATSTTLALCRMYGFGPERVQGLTSVLVAMVVVVVV
jgi:hypothetical protein